MPEKPIWMQKKSYRQLAFSIVAIVLVLVLTLFFLIPQITEIVDDYKNSQRLEAKAKQLNEKANLLETLDAAELAIRTRKLNQAIPSDEDLGYMMTALRSAVKKSGSRLVSSEYLSSVEIEPGVYQVHFELVVDGDAGTLLNLLDLLESSVPLAVVEKYGFDGDVKSSRLTASMSVKYFYSLAPVTIGKPDSPFKIISGVEEDAYQELLDRQEFEVVDLPRVPVGNENFML